MNQKKINFIKTLWGLEIDFSSQSSIKKALLSYKNEGFDGVEVATGFFPLEHRDVFNKIRKDLNLKLVAQIHTMGYPIFNENIDDHLSDFKKKAEESIIWQADHINCHTGRDSFSLSENFELFEKIEKFEEAFRLQNPNISISHETHRQRSLYSPFISKEILEKFSNFKITADISHWIVLAERLMDSSSDKNWEKLFNNFSKRTKLIHARVGTPNSIQVHKPLDGCPNTEYFENLWKNILELTEEREIYVTPEYGPYPYKPLNYNEKGCLVDINDSEDLNDTVLIALRRLREKLLV